MLLHRTLKASGPTIIPGVMLFLLVVNVKATPLDNNELRAAVSACAATGWNFSLPECAGMPDWDTSQVTDMSGLFNAGLLQEAYIFNGDISRWNTSAVQDMSNMFVFARSFNQSLALWDIGNVIKMGGMFAGTSAADFDISQWDTSSVTDMSDLFFGSSFNGDISDWDTSAVTDLSSAFEQNIHFNGDLSRWNTASVKSMSSTFDTAESFNTNIDAWDTSSVTQMNGLFSKAAAFNQSISRWNTSSATSMKWMFRQAASFNGDISSWDTSNVEGMTDMFREAVAFNVDISGWDTASVIDFSGTFFGAASFNVDLSSWTVSPSADTRFMFTGSPKLSLADINECLSAGDNVCPSETECINTDGSFECLCQSGHLQIGDQCPDLISSFFPSADGDVSNYPYRPVWEGTSSYMYVDGRIHDGQAISIIQFEGLPPASHILDATLAVYKEGDISAPDGCNDVYRLHAGAGSVSNSGIENWSRFTPKVVERFEAPHLGKVTINIKDMLLDALTHNAGSFSLLVESTNTRCKAAFATSEHDDIEHRPSLVVSYLDPATADSSLTNRRSSKLEAEKMFDSVGESDRADAGIRRWMETAAAHTDDAVPPRHYRSAGAK